MYPGASWDLTSCHCLILKEHLPPREYQKLLNILQARTDKPERSHMSALPDGKPETHPQKCDPWP